MMAFPVGITPMPVIPVPGIPIVADLFIGIPAQLPGEGTVAGHYPGSAIVGGFIPNVIMEAKVTIADKKDVLGDADSHMEPQFGGFDKEGRLLVDNSRFMVDRRRRDRTIRCRLIPMFKSTLEARCGHRGGGANNTRSHLTVLLA
jgi:hypothetical protein